MSNKSIGTAFEKEFAELLSGMGFWVHRLQDNKNGQPFDVIAVMDGEALAFDCKACERRYFDLGRIEENQHSAMQLWMECGNPEGIFAVRYPFTGIYLFPYRSIEELAQEGINTIHESNAKFYGTSFESWKEGIMHCENRNQQ